MEVPRAEAKERTESDGPICTREARGARGAAEPRTRCCGVQQQRRQHRRLVALGTAARRRASRPRRALRPTSRVELDWVPNPDHVGLYYAQDKGYFSDAEPHDRFPRRRPTPPIRSSSWASNKVDLAISYEPEMFYGQQNELPVVAVATVVPVPLNSLIISPDSSRDASCPDLSGKSVGVTGIPSDDAFYLTTLKTAGLTAGDVTKVNVGFNLVPSIAVAQGRRRSSAAIATSRRSRSSRRPAPSRPSSRRTSWVCRPTPSWSWWPTPIAWRATPPTRTPSSGSSPRWCREPTRAIADPTGATAIMKTVTQYDPKFLDESVPYTLTLLTPASGTKTGCIDVAPRGRATATG